MKAFVQAVLALLLTLAVVTGATLVTPTSAQAGVVVSEPVAEMQSTSNVTSYALGAFTPAANSVLVVFVHAGATVAAGSMSGGGLTWIKQTSIAYNAGADTLYVFYAVVGASPVSTTPTFDCTGDPADGAVMGIWQITGANTSSPVRQAKTAQTTGSNPTVTFTSAALTTSAVIAGFGVPANPPTSTPPTGWTETYDTGYPTPSKGGTGAYIQTGFTGTAVTFGRSTSSAYGIAAIEIAVATSGGGAGVQEVCGNGYDDDGVGGDASCGVPDSDRDGYVDSEDPAPTDRTIYPGVYVPCGADGTKKGQADGTYTACVEGELCEATGTGVCYYIDPSKADNTLSGHTRANAWKDWSKLSDGTSPLNAGDVVYLMTGTHASQGTYGSCGRSGLCIQNRTGTSANKITIRGYPGQTPTINLSDKVGGETCAAPGSPVNMIHAFNSPWVVVGPGLTLRDTYVGYGIWLSDGSDNVRVTGNTIRDLDGIACNNVSGITTQTVNNFELDHNFIFDIYDRSNISNQNNVGITMFRGTNGRMHHNIIYTTYAKGTGPGCAKYKHADNGDRVTAGTASVRIDDNIMWNCSGGGQGLASGEPNTHFDHNVIVSSMPFRHGDLGGPAFSNGNLIEYNLFVDTLGFDYEPTSTYGTIGSFTYQRNIVQDSSASYPQESMMIEIGIYLGDTIYNAVVPSNLSFANNCYRNTAGVTPVFGLFEGSPGTTGTSYSGLTPAWKAAFTGNETGSFNMSSNLTAETFVPTDANCLAMGPLANWVSETGSTVSGGSSTTTTTSSASTSTTTSSSLPPASAGADSKNFKRDRGKRQ